MSKQHLSVVVCGHVDAGKLIQRSRASLFFYGVWGAYLWAMRTCAVLWDYVAAAVDLIGLKSVEESFSTQIHTHASNEITVAASHGEKRSISIIPPIHSWKWFYFIPQHTHRYVILFLQSFRKVHHLWTSYLQAGRNLCSWDGKASGCCRGEG